MRNRILLAILGVVVGTTSGMALMMGLHMASGLVYPMPKDIHPMSSDPANLAAMRAWLATLPAGAFLLATLAHGLGCMGGAAVATLIAGRRSMFPALIVGAIFTVSGIQNLAEIPHPAWFAWVDLPVYLVLAAVAGRLLVRR
jgi:hypothetical protein